MNISSSGEHKVLYQMLGLRQFPSGIPTKQQTHIAISKMMAIKNIMFMLNVFDLLTLVFDFC